MHPAAFQSIIPRFFSMFMVLCFKIACYGVHDYDVSFTRLNFWLDLYGKTWIHYLDYTIVEKKVANT